jgi:hypothetical protein
MHRPHRSNDSRPAVPRERLPRSQHEPYRDGQPVHAERAVLVAVLLPDSPADLTDPLGELAALSVSDAWDKNGHMILDGDSAYVDP